jgi:hypothetical protein
MHENTVPATMTKKTRSPAKQPSSPNPRPKQRNCQTSVDKFFSLKPASRVKMNEAMNANAMDSSPPSDNESNNPYDALRDDEDDDEVPTDVEQKSVEESDNSMRSSEPSESEYESANDTMSHTRPKKLSITEDDIATQETTQSPHLNNSGMTTSPDGVNISEKMQMDSPDSKPRAQDLTAISQPCAESAGQEQLSDTARRLFENRNPPPQSKVDEITPSVLDDLLYEARQYDSTHVSSSGPTSSAALSASNMDIDQDSQRHPNRESLPIQKAPRPLPSAAGRGRGGGRPPWLASIQNYKQSSQETQTVSNQNLDDKDSPMSDAQASSNQGPDFSFSRPVYLDPTPHSPGRKNFFRCTWRVDIPKNTPPEEGVNDAILEIWSALKEADRRLVIYPWHQSSYG